MSAATIGQPQVGGVGSVGQVSNEGVDPRLDTLGHPSSAASDFLQAKLAMNGRSNEVNIGLALDRAYKSSIDEVIKSMT